MPVTGSARDRVGVVLVEFRSGGLTAQVARMATDLGCTVAVADNSGTYQGPGIVTATAGNVGFGAACNEAVRSLPASVDTLVLWNPDAVIEPAGLDVLVAAVRTQGWAAVAPALQTSRLRPAGFAYPNPWREPLVVLRELYPARRRARDHRREGASDGVLESPPRRFGSGAFLVIDRAAFADVGGFDERYFLYVEDLDLWHRLRMAGHRCGFVPSVVVTHASAGGSDASGERRMVLRWLGVELFAALQRQPSRGLRRAHRLGVRLVASAGDPVVELVRHGIRDGRGPEALQQEVRALMVEDDREHAA